MEKMELTYSFPEGLGQEERRNILEKNSGKALKRKYRPRVENDCFMLSEQGLEMEIESSSSCINRMWGFPIEGMSLIKASRTYENARLPLPRKHTDCYERWRNGECYCSGVDPYKFECTITCLPSKDLVIVDLEVGEDKDQYRRKFIDLIYKFERMIKATRSAIQLIQAFRTKPQNDGFVDRSISELFGTIGDFLS